MPYRRFPLGLLFLFAVFLLPACGPSSTEEAARPSVAAEVDPAVLETAERWLALVDADDFPGSWAATGDLFKGEVSEETWQESMAEVREQMGAVRERHLQNQTLETVMPGAPEGEYMMLEYRSVFDQQARGAELVVLMKQDDGSWRVIGYFLQ
jgi:hypothetical protein